jgi:long-chain acyl-CoA synthetase
MPINQILVHSESRAIIIGKLDSLESQQSGIPTYTKFAWAFMAMMGTLWEDIISNSQEITNVYIQNQTICIPLFIPQGQQETRKE